MVDNFSYTKKVINLLACINNFKVDLVKYNIYY